MRAIYLTGENVYLRAFQMDDKDYAMAWVDGPWPVNSVRAEELLKEWHKSFWPDKRRYAICRVSNDEVIGSCIVDVLLRTAEVVLNTAPWLKDPGDVRAEVMEIVVPWLSVEWDMMTVTVKIPSDDSEMIAKAEQLEMEHTATFREFFARRGGKRADLYFYQKLNGEIEVPGA